MSSLPSRIQVTLIQSFHWWRHILWWKTQQLVAETQSLILHWLLFALSRVVIESNLPFSAVESVSYHECSCPYCHDPYPTVSDDGCSAETTRLDGTLDWLLRISPLTSRNGNPNPLMSTHTTLHSLFCPIGPLRLIVLHQHPPLESILTLMSKFGHPRSVPTLSFLS